jgi:hypothetical protein
VCSFAQPEHIFGFVWSQSLVLCLPDQLWQHSTLQKLVCTRRGSSGTFQRNFEVGQFYDILSFSQYCLVCQDLPDCSVYKLSCCLVGCSITNAIIASGTTAAPSPTNVVTCSNSPSHTGVRMTIGLSAAVYMFQGDKIMTISIVWLLSSQSASKTKLTILETRLIETRAIFEEPELAEVGCHGSTT